MFERISLTGFSRTLRRFARATRGNVAVTFALSTLPVVGFVGAAVDFSHGNSVKAAMQSALDSTALMLARDAATLTNAQLQTKALTYFTALFTRPEAKNIQVVAVYSSASGSQLKLTGTANVDTTFMGVVGKTSMAIDATSTTAWGTSKLRVSLVLDNSGSMDDSGKMTALKTATKNLLTTLQNASSTAGDVQVAIVPFTGHVNVGTGNKNASWLDWDDWEDDNGYDNSTTTCTTKKTGKNGKSTKKCTTSTTWVPYSHSYWNGCVTDRDKDYDVKNTAPTSSNTNTYFPAEQSDYCPVEILSLGYNWTTLRNKVDAMNSNGATNQKIGLAWGWHALTQTAPLNAPTLPSDTTQVIILLSDGLNTIDRWNGNGTSWQQAVDTRQSTLCTNIKNAGIKIYTILVMEGNADLLRNCASGSDYYFNLTSATQIVTAFDAIGTSLAQLRVAK